MLTQAPPIASQYTPVTASAPDDLSGHRHRQVIGYLGLGLPLLLVLMARLRPNAPSDQWLGDSISAYYWTGAVSLFVGVLAALSLFLLTYRGYANAAHKYDRSAAVIAGVAAALVAVFPTAPTPQMKPYWWADWIGIMHTIAAVTLFSMFAVFSLWLFRKTAPARDVSPGKKRQNAIYLLCGIGIVASMVWAGVAGMSEKSIFWPETLALGFFACSWLVKGRALASINSTVTSAKGKLGT